MQILGHIISTNIGSSYLYTNIGPYYKSIGLSYISKGWFIIYMQILGHIISTNIGSLHLYMNIGPSYTNMVHHMVYNYWCFERQVSRFIGVWKMIGSGC